MDDQRTDRKSWRRLIPTPRIGLRLMLLLMALTCVLVAYLRAALDLRREAARERLIHLDTEHRNLSSAVKTGYSVSMADNRAKLVQVDAEIAELRQQLDASNKPAK